MKKTKKTYLVTALVALALAGGQSAFAKTNSDDENSVYNWGPWDKMVSPAAGPEGIEVDHLALNLPEDYEPEKRAELDSDYTFDFDCPSGALCGFGQTQQYSSSYGEDGYDGGEAPWAVALILDKAGDPTDTDWSESNFPDADNYWLLAVSSG